MQPGSKVQIIAPENQIVVCGYVNKKSNVAININAPSHLSEAIKQLVKKIKWKVQKINKEIGRAFLDPSEFIKKLEEMKKDYSNNARIFLTKMISWFGSNPFFCRLDYIEMA